MVTYGRKDTASMGFGALGLLNLGLEGGLFGTGYADPVLLPQNFAVRRGQEGPQTVITWDAPSQVLAGTYTTTYEVRLERRTLDFHDRKSDATVVSTDTVPTSLVYAGTLSGSHAVSDLTPQIKEQNSYYYTLFVKAPLSGDGYQGDDAGLFVTAPNLKKSVIVLSSSYFTNKLYSLLPSMYQASDTFPSLDSNQTPVAILTEAVGTGTDLSEQYNFAEGQTTKFGPLYRFLKIFGVSFDEIRGLIDYIPKLYDVDECDHNFIALLASNVALRFKKGLSVTQRRADIANIVHFYKWKGTGEAFETRGAAVGNARTVVVKEYNEDTLLCNDTSRITGCGGIRRGKNYAPFTILTEKQNPYRTQMTHGGLYLCGHTGNSDLAANEFTVTGLGNQVNFADIANVGSITGLDPYERLDTTGNYTVEGWIKVLRWPKASTLGTIVSVPIIERQVTWGGTAKETIRVTLNTVRLAGSGVILHRLAFYTGLVSGPDWIPVQLKEEQGHIKLNTPVHFAISRDYDAVIPTTTYTVYVNGVALDSDTSLPYTPPAVGALSSATGITFGDASASAMRDSAFSLDDVRVWEVVRSATEISENFENPVSAHTNGLLFNSGFDLCEGTTFFENSVFRNTGTSTIEGSDPYGVYPEIVGGLVNNPASEYDWEINRHQKFYINDGEYYVSGDPVGINGTAVFVHSEKLHEDYAEVTL